MSNDPSQRANRTWREKAYQCFRAGSLVRRARWPSMIVVPGAWKKVGQGVVSTACGPLENSTSRFVIGVTRFGFRRPNGSGTRGATCLGQAADGLVVEGGTDGLALARPPARWVEGTGAVRRWPGRPETRPQAGEAHGSLALRLALRTRSIRCFSSRRWARAVSSILMSFVEVRRSIFWPISSRWSRARFLASGGAAWDLP